MSNSFKQALEAFSNIPCGVHSIDADGVIVYMNQTELEWIGYSEEEVVDKLNFEDLITPEGRAQFKYKFPEFITSGMIRDLEFDLVCKNGQLLTVLINSNALYDEQGHYLCSHSFVTRIDHLKVSESKIRAQDLLTKTITDNATVAMFMMNKTGYCTFMNPAAEAMTGYTLEEIKLKPLHYMIHHHRPDGSFYPMEECPIDRALPENFDVRAHEDVFIRKDGTYFPVVCAASPIFENGVPISTVIEVRDLTEQKRYIKEIHQKTNSLEILNSIGRTISGQLDLQAILQDVTDATTKLSGAEFGAFFYNAINASGEAYMLYTLSGAPREAFEKFGMPRNTAVFHTTFSGVGVVRVDDITNDSNYGKNPPHYGMPKGHLPVVSYLAVPVISKDGSVIGGLFFGHSKAGVFTQEIEEMVVGVASQAAIAIDNARLFENLLKANNENKALLELAKESDRKKDEFMGIASHELKTPLTSLKAYTQLIVDAVEQKDYSNLSKYVYKSAEGVQKIERLVNDLLDVSRIQSGRLQLNETQFDFIKLVNTSIENIALIAPGYWVERKGLESIKIKADRERLEQVMMNLLTNAVKYSPEKREITVEVETTPSFLKTKIIDHGIGIPAEKLSKIFTRFYRVDDNSQRFAGLGIGLYISAEIIRRHGGEIGVESEEGRGSCFWFTLPIE
jgi:PAS domain S-box-containing protein